MLTVVRTDLFTLSFLFSALKIFFLILLTKIYMLCEAIAKQVNLSKQPEYIDDDSQVEENRSISI